MLPTIGRVVHYRYGHESCPALVNGSDKETNTVSLVVFSKSGGTMYLDGVKEDPEGKASCTWSWPGKPAN